ncbi:MAG TPA: TldD/PmbA family protein [Candidatus Bathyarchaeia archaeon]|jgi:predicted Zn-dependent protease|nr:TldD/PmbA family protein [Candidatus Bathyarchaeia archaeon]
MRTEDYWKFLGDVARKTVKRLENMGAAQVEAFYLATRTTETNIRNSEIFNENTIEDMGVSFRVATSDKHVGFACTNVVNTEKAVFEAGEKAFTIAKLSPSVPDFTLPTKHKIPHVKGLFDKRVANADVEETVDIAYRLIQSTENVDKRITAKGGIASFSYIQKGLVNSFGIDFEAKETQAAVYVYGSGSQGGEVTPSCGDLELKRSFDLNPEKIGKTVGEMIVAQFDPKPTSSFEGAVIFEPSAVSYQLFYAMMSALNGENVVAGSSPWVGKLGKPVASEILNAEDDGLLNEGFNSRNFDDEGFPSQKTALISRGRLKNFLQDATTANRLKMANTGNASRSGSGLEMASQIIGGGYKAKPKVFPSNLTIQAGKKTRNELISEVKKGVLVGDMGGFVQAGSGLISAQLVRAHYIENGELQYPIRGGMVSGIAFDWFKQIDVVGNDRKQFFNAVVPSLRVEGVKIIGSR